MTVRVMLWKADGQKLNKKLLNLNKRHAGITNLATT